MQVANTPTESRGGALWETPGRALKPGPAQRKRVMSLTNLTANPYDACYTRDYNFPPNYPAPLIPVYQQILPNFGGWGNPGEGTPWSPNFQIALGEAPMSYPLGGTGTAILNQWADLYDPNDPVIFRTKMSQQLANTWKYNPGFPGDPNIPAFEEGEDGYVALDILRSSDDDGWRFQVINLAKYIFGWTTLPNPELHVFDAHGICLIASDHYLPLVVSQEGDGAPHYGCSLHVYSEVMKARASIHGVVAYSIQPAYITQHFPVGGSPDANLPDNVADAGLIPSYSLTIKPFWMRCGGFASQNRGYAKKALILWRAVNKSLPAGAFDPWDPALKLLVLSDTPPA